MNFLKKIGQFFDSLFSKRTADAVMEGVRKAAPYIGMAMQITGIVAGITGGPAGRTIGTVLQAANELGVQSLVRQGATDEELATAMRDIVVASLRKKFPGASTADLNRAIELAVGAIRANS